MRAQLLGSQLADRVAALEAEKAAWATSSPTANATATTATTTATTTTTTPTKAASSKPPSASAATDPAPPSSLEATAQLRLDLAEALRGRGQAQTRLRAAEAELVTLRSNNRVDAKRISDLVAERNALTSRVRDLNEELEKKKKFLKVRGILVDATSCVAYLPACYDLRLCAAMCLLSCRASAVAKRPDLMQGGKKKRGGEEEGVTQGWRLLVQEMGGPFHADSLGLFFSRMSRTIISR